MPYPEAASHADVFTALVWQVESLRSMLQASRDKNGIYIEPWRFDQMENTITSQGNQVSLPFLPTHPSSDMKPATQRKNFLGVVSATYSAAFSLVDSSVYICNTVATACTSTYQV